MELDLVTLPHRVGEPGEPVQHPGRGVTARAVVEHPRGVCGEQQRQPLLGRAGRPQRVSRPVLIRQRDDVQHQRGLQELPQGFVGVERGLHVGQRSTSSLQIRGNLLAGGGLQLECLLHPQPGGQRPVLLGAAAHGNLERAMLLAEVVDRPDTAGPVRLGHLVQAVEQGQDLTAATHCCAID